MGRKRFFSLLYQRSHQPQPHVHVVDTCDYTLSVWTPCAVAVVMGQLKEFMKIHKKLLLMGHSTAAIDCSSWGPCGEVYTLGSWGKIDRWNDLTNDTKGQKSKKATKKAPPAPFQEKGQEGWLSHRCSIMNHQGDSSLWLVFTSCNDLIAELGYCLMTHMKRTR